MLSQRRNLIFGLLLIAVGALSLLGNLRIMDGISDYLFALLLAGGALMFLGMYRDARLMRYLVAAASLMFVALVVLIEAIPGINEDVSGVLLFWGAGAVAAHAFTVNRPKWGLALASGFSFTIGGTVLLDMLWPYADDMQGAIFMLGLSLTFAYLYSVRTEQNRLAWSGIPALCFAGIFLIILSASGELPVLFLPVALIVAGVGLLVYSNRRDRKSVV